MYIDLLQVDSGYLLACVEDGPNAKLTRTEEASIGKEPLRVVWLATQAFAARADVLILMCSVFRMQEMKLKVSPAACRRRSAFIVYSSSS